MRNKQRVPSKHKGIDVLLLHHGKDPVDLVSTFDLQGEQCHAQGWGCGLERLQLGRVRGVGRIPEDSDPRG